MSSNMRVTTLLLFALLFAVTPFYILNALVVPQLETLQATYAQADKIAQGVAGQ